MTTLANITSVATATATATAITTSAITTSAITTSAIAASAITNSADTDTLTWTTKTGKVRVAHTASAQARGNRSANLARADKKTLSQLLQGQYRPFQQDILNVCSKGHRVALKAYVGQSLGKVVDGVMYAPVVDFGASINKPMILAVCAWLGSPTAEVKGVTGPKPLPKSGLYLAAMAWQWSKELSKVTPSATLSADELAELADIDPANLPVDATT